MVCTAALCKFQALCSLAAMSWKRPNNGSRMNREVHVRFWESPEVKVLRATRHERRFRDVRERVRSASDSGKIAASQRTNVKGHGLPLRLRWYDDRCSPDSRRLAARPKSAE